MPTAMSFFFVRENFPTQTQNNSHSFVFHLGSSTTTTKYLQPFCHIIIRMLPSTVVEGTQRNRTTSRSFPLRIPMMLQVQLLLLLPVVFLCGSSSIVDAYPMTTGIFSPRRANSQLTAFDDIHRAYTNTNTGSHPTTTPTITATTPTVTTTTTTTSGDVVRRAWVDKSIRYYSTVMREERRKQLGQIRPTTADSDAAQMEFEQMAYKHYFALRKVKDGKPHHAERIYRRIIHELQQEVEGSGSSMDGTDPEQHHHCDHAKFAITTLLLALHMQRSNKDDAKATRSVFLNFFRTVVAASNTSSSSSSSSTTNHPEPPFHQCACSAKVLQAFALFEMKQGNELKSLEIILHAIRYDPSLNTILNWKQFRDVQARKQQRSSRSTTTVGRSTTLTR